MGGWDGQSNLACAERFDGAAWAPLPPLSKSRRGLAAAVVGGRLYVVGGWDGDGYLAAVEVFDPAAGRWATGRPMLQVRGVLLRCVGTG